MKKTFNSISYFDTELDIMFFDEISLTLRQYFFRIIDDSSLLIHNPIKLYLY